MSRFFVPSRNLGFLDRAFSGQSSALSLLILIFGVPLSGGPEGWWGSREFRDVFGWVRVNPKTREKGQGRGENAGGSRPEAGGWKDGGRDEEQVQGARYQVYGKDED
jgi:hypothetical protein